MTALLATGVFALPLGSALAAQAKRDDAGPAAAEPPAATPPAETPPVTPPTTPPAETPPVETPPAETPPVEPPPPRPVEAPKKPVSPPPEDDSFDGGFEVTDLTEDEEALKKELEVKTVDVKGAKGTITGKVKDATNGQPMIGAYVEAIGTPYKTKTDLEGNYTLDLPPGKYDVRIRYDTSEPRRISGVVVEKDKEQAINTELQPLAGGGQTVAIKAEMNRESEGARLLQRRESAASRDILSRESIKRSGGGSTASVAVRIVGATVIEGKYLFVRGLGHRYGNTLFDGARVPSPEPDLRTVPLDIFPSGALSAINVQKTFTPDMPGDFAGASVQLESREVPDKLLLELSVNLAANTQTTFRSIYHEGGFPAADFFGFGNIPRGMSSALPTDAPASRSELDENFQPKWTPEELERFGESLYTDTRVRHGRIGPPNGSAGATVGYGFKPHDGGKLGFLVSAFYRNQHQNYPEIWRWYGNSDGEVAPTPQVNYSGRRTVQSVQWSTVGLVKYDINKSNRLSASIMYSRDADDEVRSLEGFNTNVAQVTRDTRVRYLMRSLLFTRLGGSHKIAKAKNFTIDWFGSYAQGRRDDPSLREMVYSEQTAGTGDFTLTPSGADNLFFQLLDHTESGAVNFTLPFAQWAQLPSKFKFGAWVEGKQRGFDVRRFEFQTATGFTREPGVGNVLVDDTIGGGLSPSQGGTEPYLVSESTQPFDSYKAQQEIYATYAMLDLPFVRWFRMVGGARFEGNRQRVSPYDIFGREVDPTSKARVSDNDILPSVALIFPTTDKMNVRLSGTGTVARPEFRELAPYLFNDFAGGVSVQGNPNLESTRVWNADARWEWFPSAEEVVAVSLFYKYFDSPIERVVLSGMSGIPTGYRNAKWAQNAGVEFELRKNLEFMWKKLSDVSVGLNFAYVWSRVQLKESCNIMDLGCNPADSLDVSTSRSRPLQGQSPFVANAYLDYDNKRSGTGVRVLYNTVLRNVALVNGNNSPDIYAEPIHQLDLFAKQRVYKRLDLTLGVQNVLNWPIRWVQGSEKTLIYRSYRGATISVGLAFAL